MSYLSQGMTCPKVKVMAQLNIELVYFDISAQHEELLTVTTLSRKSIMMDPFMSQTTVTMISLLIAASTMFSFPESL